MVSKNSLTTLLGDLLKVQNNAYSIITRLSDLVTSNSDQVTIDVIDGTGSIRKVTVPGWGALKQELISIQNTLKSLTESEEPIVQLSDGTYRKLIRKELEREAKKITSLTTPKTFGRKENWFFESFLNPQLYVSFDLTGKVKSWSERIEVARYVLTLDTDEKIESFRTNLLGRNDITETEFYNWIQTSGTQYFLDRDVISLPPKSLRYSGSFAVTDIREDSSTEVVESTTFVNRVLKVRLDKLVYDDAQSQYKGTRALKIGDSLIKGNTRWIINSIDASRREVELKRIEGFETIMVGDSELNYFGELDEEVNAQVLIGFGEWTVVFLKAIDPDSEISAVEWSPGVAFYSSDLEITVSGKTQKLSTYYRNEVVDFGMMLYGMLKDNPIPAQLGIKPDAPFLSSDNFKVVAINNHLSGSKNSERLKSLQTEKIRLKSSIETLEKQITEKRNRLLTTKWQTQSAKNAEESELNRLILRKETDTKLLRTAVDNIFEITSGIINATDPKYRVRGFWAFPEKKTGDRTGDQNVIQFRIQYRYLRKGTEEPNQPNEINFTDGTTDSKGVFSTWNEILTGLRKKSIDPQTGKGLWLNEDLLNSEEVNVNQLDIPIQSGESVQIRIKSISEAGFPSNPLESDWSASVIVDFPDEYENTTTNQEIIQRNQEEKSRLLVQDELSNLKLDKVSSSTFIQNDKFWLSTSENIASGFLNSNNQIISLFDKIKEMENELVRLRGLIEKAKGTLVVKIVDETGAEYTVNRDQKITMYAGSYKEGIKSFSVKKGAIVTKNYWIKIQNTASGSLELWSKLWGIGSERLTDGDYSKYPISVLNPSEYVVSGETYPHSITQRKGQWINFGSTSIDGYTSWTPGNTTVNYLTNIENIPTFSVGSQASFMVSGFSVSDNNNISSMTTGGSTNVTFGIHESHPIVQNVAGQLFSVVCDNILKNTRLSKYIRSEQSTYSLPSGATMPENVLGQNTNFFDYPINAFRPTDQFLIGASTVGSYLFPLISDLDLIRVNSKNINANRLVEFGDDNSILIPIRFQYRMTDFWGEGTDGIGNIDGINTLSDSDDFIYRKGMRVDIHFDRQTQDTFSFDFEVWATYQTDPNLTGTSQRSFETAIDDLNKTIKSVSVGTSRTNNS